MRFIYLLFLFPILLHAQSGSLYNDDQIAAIYVEMPQDSFEWILEEQINDRYLSARFIFDDGTNRDTVESIGIRLRGNTSLSAAKKSFKISFNEFSAGREFQGVRKLNLRGQANDPTLIREKMYYEIWKNAGMPERRAAFVRFFVNGEYRGLYTNIEEIDKQWLDRAYADNDGNLYKCLWPADLRWLGSDQNAYKNILHDTDERAYRLVTNEAADDYSRFVQLVEAINQPISAAYADQLRTILNVEGVLKAYAIDVATGNWDNYFYLKNNYYLYDNPATGRFEWIAYDTDNSCGVDWLGRDWAQRNCLNWQNSGEPRPLATQLMAVPEFKQYFINILDSISQHISCPEMIFPRIDALHAQITPAAETDPFRPLDFGYSVADFHAAFDQTIDGHTPYGIKPFFTTRCAATQSQLAGLVGTLETSEVGFKLRIAPNPVGDEFSIVIAGGLLADSAGALIEIRNAQGQLVSSVPLDETIRFRVGELPPGLYCLVYRQSGFETAKKFLKL